MTASATARPRRRSARSSDGLETRRRAFDAYLARALPPLSAAPRRLHEAMRYAALSPGKRLRPLLALTACEAAGGPWRRALPVAAALECVHAFSLVHDDLPAMDDDDYRRGRPTTHKKYGEAMGVLAGDALLALAFEQLEHLSGRVPERDIVRALGILARAAGSRELVGGQVLDLEAEKKRATRRMVRDIHLRKTGALIAAALELGGVVAGATERRRRTLARLGRNLGLAFQIHDDLLNRGSSLARLGKRAGTDDARGKATYPRAVGEACARADAARLYARTLDEIEKLGPRASHLARLVQAAAERQR